MRKSKRRSPTFQVRDHVLIKQRQDTKFGRTIYKGSFIVISAPQANVVVNAGTTTDTYSIRHMKHCII